MRRIFPSKGGPNSVPLDGEAGKKGNYQLPPSGDSGRRDGSRQKKLASAQDKHSCPLPEVRRQSSVSDANSKGKRDHWCPTYSEAADFRCETPSSGDENVCCQVDSGNASSARYSQDDCQDKQVVRALVNATSKSSSPDGLDQDSRANGSLNRAISASRQEIRRKVNDHPKRASSPQLPCTKDEDKAWQNDSNQGNVAKLDSRSQSSEHYQCTLRENSVALSDATSTEHDFPRQSLSHSSYFEDEFSSVSSSYDVEDRNLGTCGRFTRSHSISGDSASIMSRPRSQSFSEYSLREARSDNRSEQGHAPDLCSTAYSRDRSHFKYLSARAVAERLAKAIRGSSKTSSKTTRGHPPPVPCSSASRAGISVSEQSKSKLRETLQADKLVDQLLDERLSFEEKVQGGASKDILKSRLESHTKKIDFLYDDLDRRAQSAEERLLYLEGELSWTDEKGMPSRDADTHQALLQKIKKLQKEKQDLAREVVSEVRLRMTERATVREVVVFMKRDIEYWTKCLERDLQNELQKRQADVDLKIEKVHIEDSWLQDKVRKLSEEKSWLQKELSSSSFVESTLREKIKSLEFQMSAHVKRAQDADCKLSELRESLTNAHERTKQAEQEMENLRKDIKEKNAENIKLSELVVRSRQFCSDNEKSIRDLQQSLRIISDVKPDKWEEHFQRIWQEFLRLCSSGQALEKEIDASTVEAASVKYELEDMEHTGNDYMNLCRGSQSDVDYSIMELYQVKDQSAPLLSRRQISQLGREENLGNIGVAKDGRRIDLPLTRDKDLECLENGVGTFMKTNQILYSFLRKDLTAGGKGMVHVKEKVIKEAQQMSSGVNTCMQGEFPNEGGEIVNVESQDQSDKGTVKEEDVIQGLQHSLGDMTKALSNQNGRIQRLTGRNDELLRLYNSKEVELLDIQSRLREETEHRRATVTEFEQAKHQLKDLHLKLKNNESLCQCLREKLSLNEREQELHSGQIVDLQRERDSLKEEVRRLQSLLEASTREAAEHEHQAREKDNNIGMLQQNLSKCLKELERYQKEYPKILKQRDGMQKEAEELGREALRMSAEAEVLRRKVHQLEEDIMLRDGQLSILQGSFDEND